MYKVLGYITGSAISIGVMWLMLGVPKLLVDEELPGDNNAPVAAEAAAISSTDTESPERASSDLPVVKPEATATAPLHNDPIEPTQIDDFRIDEPGSSEIALDDIQIDNTQQTAGEVEIFSNTNEAEPIAKFAEVQQVGSETQWQAFWNPFRSQIAANGFVGQLEKVTGFEYRVVKLKAGVYEVAFAYADDAERQAKLTQIAAATGLELAAL